MGRLTVTRGTGDQGGPPVCSPVTPISPPPPLHLAVTQLIPFVLHDGIQTALEIPSKRRLPGASRPRPRHVGPCGLRPEAVVPQLDTLGSAVL
ncbi:unnamed protein product [Arctogadus glacialis]